MKKFALLFMMAIFLVGAACLPVYAATVTVDSTTDEADGTTSSISALIADPGADGVISLREAMTAAINTGGSDTIEFNIPKTDEGFTTQEAGVIEYWKIKPLTAGLPALDWPGGEGTIIAGETQTTNQGDTNNFGPEILIDGSIYGALTVKTYSCVIRNLVINGANRGIYIDASTSTLSNNRIYGCYLGTDVTGEAAVPGSSYGIYISGHSWGTVIGSTEASNRNIISGNSSSGIYIKGKPAGDTSSATIIGNYIGTNRDGTRDLGNASAGIFLYDDVRNCQIGGSNAGEGNLISGNGSPYGEGILMGVNGGGTNVRENDILGNKIGTNADGTAALANGAHGIYIQYGAHDNNIGDGTAGGRNIISGNTYDGIEIRSSGSDVNQILGNYIGTNLAGTASIANGRNGVNIFDGPQNTRIDGNVISASVQNGIIISDGSHYTEVYDNYIGTNANGTAALGNVYHGVSVAGSHYNKIGSTADGGNVISGNGYDGIVLVDTSSNEVYDNYIGTDANGTTALANGNSGIEMAYGADHNIIGNGESSGRNIISGNTQVGVSVKGCSHLQILGNYIGTTANGESALANQGEGVTIGPGTTESSTYNEIRNNVISGNAVTGVNIYGSGASLMANHNRVLGNIIGLDKDGTSDLGNANYGVAITTYSEYNIIGSTESSGRNIISGNDSNGIALEHQSCRYNQVLGNFIGTDVSGTLDRGNTTTGVRIYEGASYNLIGSTESGGRNIISGNDSFGLSIQGTAGNICEQNQIFGNYIGTTLNGTAALGNGSVGILIAEYSQHNKIGDGTSAGRNVIAANVDSGISIYGTENGSNEVLANYIGTDKDGALALNAANAFANTGDGIGIGSDHNECFQNIISGNGGSGIDISDGADYNQCSLNIIYGNAESGVGIDTNSDYNLVSGNSIEANSTFGVAIEETSNYNQISENIISGSGFPGVWISGSSEANQIGPGNTIAYNATTEAAALFFYNYFAPFGVEIWPAGIFMMGDSAAGARTIYNTITQNSIYENGYEGAIDVNGGKLAVGLGIFLLDGANEDIAAPSISRIDYIAPWAVVTGEAAANATVELFTTNGPDPCGSGEGKVYLASGSSDAAGNWSIASSVTSTATLTATVTDANGNTSMFSVNKSVSEAEEDDIPISDQPYVKLRSPNRGIVWQGGMIQNIRWYAVDDTHGITGINLYYSIGDDWANAETIASGISDSGYYEWTVPSINESTLKIRIEAINGNSEIVEIATSESDGYFSIFSAPSYISISNPSSGERLLGGSSYDITYTVTTEVGLATPVTLGFSDDNQASWQPLTSETWSVPRVDKTACFVSAEAEDNVGTELSALSGQFVIDSTSPEVLSIDPANGAASVAVDKDITVEFTEGMNADSVVNAFSLLSSAGAAVSGRFSFSADTAIVTFEPAADLSYETTYEVTITEDAQDLAGNSLIGNSDFISGFTTAAEGVEEPGEVEVRLYSYTTDQEAKFIVANEDPIQFDAKFEVDAITEDLVEILMWVDELRTFATAVKTSQTSANSIFNLDLDPGEHTLKVEVKDQATGRVLYTKEITVTVARVGAAVAVSSMLAYPTTFSPSAGQATALSYKLNKDAYTTHYIISPAGQVVWVRKFGPGSRGGRAGYNSVAFDGRSDIDKTYIAKGIYVWQIVPKDGEFTKGYIVVY